MKLISGIYIFLFMKSSQSVNVNESIVSNSTVSPSHLVEISPSELLKRIFKKYDEDRDGRLTKP